MPGTMETSVIATQSGWAKLAPPGLGAIGGGSTGLKVLGLVLVSSAGRHVLLHPVPALPLLPGHCKHQPTSPALTLECGLLSSSTHVGLLRAERGFNVDWSSCEISSP